MWYLSSARELHSIQEMNIDIYTDGSCITETRLGAWVAILLTDQQKITLSGTEADTTHNRMELMAVLQALEYVRINCATVTAIRVHSDSQYVCGLPSRRERLQKKGFTTRKGESIRNDDLVKSLYDMQEGRVTDFVKVKAHERKTGEINYNIEADMLVRKLAREMTE